MDEKAPLMMPDTPGVNAFVVTGDSSTVCDGDRKGFAMTIENCGRRNVDEPMETPVPQFDPTSYNDFDICYVFSSEPKKPEKEMSVEEVKKQALLICRARHGGDYSRYDDVSSLHPVYALDGRLEKPMTHKEFHKLMVDTFYRVLNHIRAIHVIEQGYDKNRDTYIRVRLPEDACMAVADYKGYPLRMDRNCTKYPEFREDPDYAAPHLAYERTTEEKARDLAGSRNGGKLWSRYDRLGRQVGNIPEVSPVHHELSVFRDIDRIRLLYIAVYEFLNVDAMTKKKWMKTFYVLKQSAQEEALKQSWGNFKHIASTKQPLDQIRNYLGEEMALYFAWMGFYTKQILSPGIVGLVVTILYLIFDPHSRYMVPWLNYVRLFYCIFLGGWCTYYFQMWLRTEKILSLKWGEETAKMSRALVEETPYFKPDGYIVDPVQPDRFLKYGDPAKRRAKEFVTSSILVFSTVVCTIAVNEDLSRGLSTMLGYPMSKTFGEALLMRIGGDEYIDHALFLVSVTTLMIKLLDKLWSKKIAAWLTEWENHQYVTAYNNSLNFKLFFFKIVDYFAMLCYLAFFKEYLDPCDDMPDGRCLHALRRQLVALVVIELFGTLKEFGKPWLTYTIKKFMAKPEEGLPDYQRQAMLPAYAGRKGVTGDYLDQMINFGFTSMFSLVLPFLPIITYMVNLLEIRTDAKKVLNSVQRPFPKMTADQGVWDDVQRAVCFMAVIINVALCAFCTIGYLHGLAFRLFWCLMLMLAGLGIKQVMESKLPADSSKYRIMKARDQVVYYDAVWGDRDGAKLAAAFGAAARV